MDVYGGKKIEAQYQRSSVLLVSRSIVPLATYSENKQKGSSLGQMYALSMDMFVDFEGSLEF